MISFFFGCAGSLLWHVGFSSCGMQVPECADSVVVVRRLSSCSTHGLGCPVAHGILVPQPGIEPASSALEGGFFFFLEGRFLTTGPQGKSMGQDLLIPQRLPK